MGLKKLNLMKETLVVLEGDRAEAAGAGTKYCGYTNTCEASKGNNTCNTCFCTVLCAPSAFCFPI